MDVFGLLEAIGNTGTNSIAAPQARTLRPFNRLFLPDGSIDLERLDEIDGGLTGREALTRFLILNAVLDQGPDIAGVRMLLGKVVDGLYRKKIRIFHDPASFFSHLDEVASQVLSAHDEVKKARADIWASAVGANPNSYNLFIDRTRQVMNYVVFRWGVPIALPIFLKERAQKPSDYPTLVVDYLDSFASAEEMSRQLKDHYQYGLGKAIGDKACHLFAKWYCHTFKLARGSQDRWGPFSFEIPFDSNVGRVLWRTGFFLNWASESDYERRDVIQRGKGKQGTDYIRVTNIRDMPVTLGGSRKMLKDYQEAVSLGLNAGTPRIMRIQRMPHAILLGKRNATDISPGDVDDGLIEIGTKYCYNTGTPRCGECPIARRCEGATRSSRLIRGFRT